MSTFSVINERRDAAARGPSTLSRSFNLADTVDAPGIARISKRLAIGSPWRDGTSVLARWVACAETHRWTASVVRHTDNGGGAEHTDESGLSYRR